MLDVTREPQPGTFSPPLLTTIPGHSGATLTVLLDRIARRPGRPTAMLRTTAAHLARYRGAPATDLKCDATLAALPGFATWFGRIARKNACPLTYSSVQSNLNHARIPLATARESGCKLTPILADLTWRPVFFRGSSCEAALCPADHAARSTRLLVPRSECIPSDQLTVDLLHSAVRLLYEDEGATPLVAPGVRVLNLSIGDPSRTLDGPMSPLPRMIDWLSWRYRVLFLVSAGNANSPLELDVARADVAALDAAGLSAAIARSIHAVAHLRRILSPSESVNAFTVGSLHGDDSDSGAPPNTIDPYPQTGYPSPLKRIGLGFKRGVKPDVLFEGGVQLYRLSPNPAAPSAVLELAQTYRSGPGQLVASPGRAGELRASRFLCGTSNATALGSRSCDRILSMLEQINFEWSDEQIAVLTKVLLVHGCEWTEAAEFFRQSLELGRDNRDHIARYLGYGAVSLERVLVCEDNRVTVISASDIADGEGHLYQLPLPPTWPVTITICSIWNSRVIRPATSYRAAAGPTSTI